MIFSFDLVDPLSGEQFEFDQQGGPGTPGSLSKERPQRGDSVQLTGEKNDEVYYFTNDPNFSWGIKGVLRLKDPSSPYKPYEHDIPEPFEASTTSKPYIFDRIDPVLKALYELENTHQVRELIFLYIWEEQRKAQLVQAARQLETDVRAITNNLFEPLSYGHRRYMEAAEAYHTMENKLAFKKKCETCDSPMIQFQWKDRKEVFCSEGCAQQLWNNQ